MNNLESIYLGELEVIEIYEYYDQPVLFACQNELGHIFIVLFEGDDKGYSEWLYLPVSKERFDAIRTGIVDLHDAFAHNESGYIFKVDEAEDGQRFVTQITNVSSDRLPDKGERLSLQPNTAEDVISLATRIQRDVIKVRLVFGDPELHEAPAQDFGNILVSFQMLMNSVALGLDTLYKQAKKPPKALIQALELSLTPQFSRGSFLFELLAPANVEDDFHAEILSNVLDGLATIINTENNAQKIQDVLRNYPYQKLPSSYLRFLESIKSSVDTTEIEWASYRTARYGSMRVLASSVIETIKILNEMSDDSSKQITVTGILLGFDVEKKEFRIDYPKEKKSISGKVDSNVSQEDFNFMANVTISKRYKATIKERVVYKPASDETKTTYTLIKLEEAPI